MQRPCLVILGDESPLLSAAAASLRGAGADVHLASSADRIEEMNSLLPDMFVASESLSDAELLRVSRRLRSAIALHHVASLVLVSVSGREGGATPPEDDRRSGLELAESIAQLLHTAQAIRARRDVIALAGLQLDRRGYRVTVDGETVPLTVTEFHLLWTLARVANRVFTRAELCDACGARQSAGHERTIDVHIRSIRNKLGPLGQAIVTVRGLGYTFRASSPAGRPLEMAS